MRRHYLWLLATLAAMACPASADWMPLCATEADCPAQHICDPVRRICILRVWDLGTPDAKTAADTVSPDTVSPDTVSPDTLPTCSDGTPSGQCSATKPKYCDAGVLAAKCAGPDGVPGNGDDCGCPTGGICRSDGTCCVPSCAGKNCGKDGCGGSCGACDGFPCQGNNPICRNGVCGPCHCPNNCYNINAYCGAQGGVLTDCKFAVPTPTNTNYCFCWVRCTSGDPPDLEIGDSC